MKHGEKKRRHIVGRVVLVLAALLVLVLAEELLFGNTSLTVTRFTVSSSRLPGGFDGCRILHLSDLHDFSAGSASEKLVTLSVKLEPDLIVITGDLVDSKRTDIGALIRVAEKLKKIAPVYCVTGNHEAVLSQKKMNTLRDGLSGLGIPLMENESLYLERGGDHICLIGLKDIGFIRKEGIEKRIAQMLSDLQGLMGGTDEFTLVLAHRPELIEAYEEAGADLVLSGHAHGGQARLPFVGGIYAPGQGMLPKYDAGLYSQGNTQMIVSRGIGNSAFPFRIFNRPELVLITLKTEK